MIMVSINTVMANEVISEPIESRIRIYGAIINFAAEYTKDGVTVLSEKPCSNKLKNAMQLTTVNVMNANPNALNRI